jgi:hypothetical protein
MIDHMRRDATPTGRGPGKCGVLRRARLRHSTHHNCRPLLFKVTPAVHSRSFRGEPLSRFAMGALCHLWN